MLDGKTILDLWPIIVAIFCLVIWAIRLEAKVIYLDITAKEKHAEYVKKDEVFWSKIDSLQTSMNQVLQALGELKGKINQ